MFCDRFFLECVILSSRLVQNVLKNGEMSSSLKDVLNELKKYSDSDDEELTKQTEIKQNDSDDIHFLPCRFDFPCAQYCH